MKALVALVCLFVLGLVAISAVLFAVELCADLIGELADKVGVLPVLAGVVVAALAGFYWAIN